MSPGGAKPFQQWLESAGPESDVVVSSRVRLARNLAGFPFLSKARRDDRRQIIELVQKQVLCAGLAPQVMWVELNELPALERNLLVERHLISKQHAKGSEPRAVAISNPDERLAIMVNEEDHLRIQVMRPGFALNEAFTQINEVDDRIESKLDYAFSTRFGYLAACPTNVGTGIRVSAMVHLPALKIAGDLEKVRRAAKGMNIAVRGYYGEGSEAAGDLYQISNQITLGRTEEEILDAFESQLVPQIIEYERLSRKSLMQKKRTFLEDQVHRAYGILRSARLMKADEALEHLSLLRLGLAAGILTDIQPSLISRLILLCQPAHLQKMAKRELDQAERRIERATMLREQLAGRPAQG